MWNDQGYVDQQIYAAFSRHDTNGSGFLDPYELANVLNEIYAAMNRPIRLNAQQAQLAMYDVDKNGDGRISRKQFKKVYRQVLNNPNKYAGQGFQQGGFQQGGFQQGGFQQGFQQGGFQQGGFQQGGFNQGGFQQGGFNQGGFNQGGFQQSGVINLGGGFGNQGSFHYNGTWNAGNDQYLQNQIDMVYAKYDRNMTGQLEQQEFFNAYTELCRAMNQNAPNDFYTIQQIAQKSDTNFDGRVSKMEMLNLFKRAQFNIY